MNLSYDYKMAKIPPLEAVNKLGIKYRDFHFDKKSMIFFLFDCENVPVILPEYFNIEKETPFLNRKQRRKFAKENR